MARHCRPLIHVSLVRQWNPLLGFLDRDLLAWAHTILLVFQETTHIRSKVGSSSRLHFLEVFYRRVPKVGWSFQDQLFNVKFVLLLELWLHQDRSHVFGLSFTILHLGSFSHLWVLHQTKVLEKRRESFAIIFWNLGKNDFHGDLFSKTRSHSLILQQLVVTFEVFLEILGFQDEHVVWSGNNLTPLEMLPRRSDYILNQFGSGSYELLANRYFLVWAQELTQINLRIYSRNTVESLWYWALKDVAGVFGALILQELAREESSFEVVCLFEIPPKVVNV